MNDNFLKKHADTISIIISIIIAMGWINTKFTSVENKIVTLEKEMAIVKTVLFMQKILPSELVANEK
jgi:hypothetical protein